HANSYDIAVMGSGTGTNAPSVAKIQGAITGVISPTLLVRNKYGASCGSANKWYVTAYTSMTTIAHGCNSDAVTQPTPQPSCSSNILNVVPTLFALTYTADCPTGIASSGAGSGTAAPSPSVVIANINTYISDLRAAPSD